MPPLRRRRRLPGSTCSSFVRAVAAVASSGSHASRASRLVMIVETSSALSSSGGIFMLGRSA